MGDVLVQWQRFVGELTPDTALRQIILESWRRSRAAGVDPDPTRLAVRRVPGDELGRRLAANAELLELARPHLEWLSAVHASVPHVAYVVDRDGVVLYATGTDPEAMREAGLLPGYDWSEAAMGTNGAGTALVVGEAVAVEGPEHFARPLHDYTCTGAPVRGPAGEVIGALDLSTAAEQGAPQRLLVVAHAAYAVGQELRYRDSLRRTSGDLEAERRLAEALRQSEALLRGAFDQAPIGMALTTPDGRWLRVNRALCEIVGYDEAALRATTFQAITHPDDVEGNLELQRQLLAGESTECRIEKRYVHRQGHAVWVALNAALVRDAAGAPMYFLVQIQDVTERKRAEQALRESEERFRRLVESSPDGIVVVHGGGTILFANPAAARDFRAAGPETLVGMSVTDLVSPDSTATLLDLAERPHATGTNVRTSEERLRRLDGTTFDAETSAIALTYQGRPAVQVSIRDVSARKGAEAEVRRQALVFETIGDAVIVMDAHGQIVDWNPSAERMYGYSKDEMLGQSPAVFHHPDLGGRLEETIRSALQRERRWAGELRFVRKDGREGIADVVVVNQYDAAGAPIARIGINRDVTERKALEAQLRQAQKMEAVGQLAGGVAHDFNNLLTIVKVHAELGLAELGAAHPARADFEEIGRAAARADALTRQLLAFSRKQVLQPQALELNTIVREAAALLRPLLGGALHLVTLPAPMPVPVFADRTQLEQMLLNLAVNARDAMPDGGTLTIEVGVAPAAAGARPAATLAVSDTGVGMPSEVQARLFEPFFTTKPVGQGTGLGLATVHGIVQQSGGTIRVASRPGAGTTFTVTLPLAEPAPAPHSSAAAPAAVSAAEAGPGRGAGMVLLVEDEETVRAVGQRLLERAGYRVLSAPQGADALRLLAEHGPAVDVLLSDVVMPEMGGVELTARAVEWAPGLRVVLMSGYADADIGAIGEGERVTGFVQKPFTAESLLAAVHAAAEAAGRSKERGR